MYNYNETTENKILSFDKILKDLSIFEYSPSKDVEYLINNPIDVFIKEILPIKIKDPYRLNRIKETLNKINSKNYIEFDSATIKDKAKEILEEFNQCGNFSFLKSRDIRCLLRYDVLWLSDDYNDYKKSFIKYIQSEDKFYRQFKHILQLYIRLYSKLNNDKTFKELFSNVYKKYIANKKFIPDYIQNFIKDCDGDISKKDIEKVLSEKCLNERFDSNIAIIERIKNRYRYIRQNTDLFNAIMVKICEYCKNKIKEEFYFELLFNEILSADIDSKLSGKIVSEIIKLFVKDKNVSQTDLGKIKVALLRNPNYGDPRIRKRVRNYWDDVDSESKHIFITWLAKADLDFFFKIAFKGIDDRHRRKTFWQKYINSRQLVESHVILSQTHYHMPEVQEEQKRNNITFKRFESEDDCSCFILKFNNIYVIEFSEYANAVYFYSEEEFCRIVDLQRQLYSTTDDLKRLGKKTEQFSKQNNGKVPNLTNCGGAFKIYHSGDEGTWENLVEIALNTYVIYRGE